VAGVGNDTSVGALDGVSIDPLSLQRDFRLGVQVIKSPGREEGVSIDSVGGTGEGTALGAPEGAALDSIIIGQDA
jgi:hypothetical protein